MDLENFNSKTSANDKNKGFVVLVSVIIITIVVTLGIGILNIALKELIIANFQKESLKALSAADAGIDCAFSYDVNPIGAPPRSTYESKLFDSITNGNPTDVGYDKPYIWCNDEKLVTNVSIEDVICEVSGETNNVCYKTTLYEEGGLAEEGLVFEDGSCVNIEVRKIILNSGKERTEIEAKGKNDCDASRRLERTLLLRWDFK